MYMWSHKSRCDCVHVRTLKTSTCKRLCFQVFFISSSMTMNLVFVDILLEIISPEGLSSLHVYHMVWVEAHP